MKCPECKTEIGEESHFCSKCGTQVKLAEEAPVSFTKTLQTPSTGVRIGSNFAERYRIVDELGRGGMGIVYKAVDLRLERLVALKFLPPELTQDEAAKERFVREARAAAAVAHSNICTIHEIDEFEDQTFIAMEFVEGLSLRQVTKKQAVSVGEALDLAIQIASGLEEAHKKGIIHRDIKSANIMVNKTGQAKIMDFGLAKVSGSALITREGVAMGTVAYMSPEQARGSQVDHRTDIWSLGVVLYEMLSGQLPFWGEKEASILYSIEHREHKPVRAFNPNIPAEFEAIINRCLQKKPEARYKSSEDIVSALQKYQDTLRAEEAGFFNLKSLLRRLRQPKIAIPLSIGILAIGASSAWYLNRQSKIRWAERELLPQMALLIEEAKVRVPEERHVQAYEIGLEAEKYLAGNPELIDLFSKCSASIKVETDPPGADVYIKPYDESEKEWEYIGFSDLKALRLPYRYFLFKLEKEGYETTVTAHLPYHQKPTTSIKIVWDLKRKLIKIGDHPENMELIQPQMSLSSQMYPSKLPEYFIDKYEVSNKDYKEFVNGSGYQNRDLWKYPFIKDGKDLSWEEAISEFVDATGYPGPSTWRAGDYPEGESDHPVSGVSWYEAAAYAEFAGKKLPTQVHWRYASGWQYVPHRLNGFHTKITQRSNFSTRGSRPVGDSLAVGLLGLCDMPGNVREWCWNETAVGRCITGGAWKDDGLLWITPSGSPSFDRSETNGFRCAIYLNESEIPENVFSKYLQGSRRDYSTEKPVTDEMYESYKAIYQYDKTDFNAEIELKDETNSEWVMEKVSYSTVYGDERIPAYLFLPKKYSPPYQVVVYFPGAGALFFAGESDNMGKRRQFKDNLAFLVKNGRAVLFPIYKGTYDRGDPAVYGPLYRGTGFAAKDYTVQTIQDFRRSIDYLETRPEINCKKIAYYGFSWGGWLGAIIPAVEERVAVSVLNMAGLMPFHPRPEVDPFNFITRVKIPTLIMNGKYDTASFPQETHAIPFYEHLGTPVEHKYHEVFESDHFIPTDGLIQKTSEFLDKYLGPVTMSEQFRQNE